MKVQGKDYRTVWMEHASVYMIDQTLLPFKFVIHECKSCSETCDAIRTMMVRGAGAIGAAAGFAMAQTFLESADETSRLAGRKAIESTRPTAQNLFYATKRVYEEGSTHGADAAVSEAQSVADEDAATSQKIGEFGDSLIKNGFGIETHCNAGWLAFVDFGTALSPIYRAHRAGKDIMVYVDETGPRGQGAKLTSWELQNENVPYKILPDTAGADLMKAGKIQMVIVGADRIAANGDTANKIGTYQKAILAKHFGIPFYVAAPTSTIDMKCLNGSAIPIEHRNEDEVLYAYGQTSDGKMEKVLVCAPNSPVYNPSFDVTPAALITAFITEQGIVKPAQVADLIVKKVTTVQ
jgi:S-methyl-5-thioribose-1-phosphate isomerase